MKPAQFNPISSFASKLKVDAGRTKTEESTLEKLRCLPAGRTKKGVIWDMKISLKKGLGGAYLYAQLYGVPHPLGCTTIQIG